MTGRIVKALWAMCCILMMTATAQAITLEEALRIARENHPSLKAQEIRVGASENLEKAAFSPYYPSLNLGGSLNRYLVSSEDYNSSSLNATLSYLLYDGGSRSAGLHIAQLSHEQEKAEALRLQLDLEFSVKSAFYTALGLKSVTEFKKATVLDAKKLVEVAEGRYKLGAGRYSEALQARVQLSEAMYAELSAESDYKKSLSDFNSLLGKPLDISYELEGVLGTFPAEYEITELVSIASERPELRKLKLSTDIAKNNIAAAGSGAFPKVSVSASFIRTDGGPRDTSANEGVFGVGLSWSVFDRGIHYRKLAASEEVSARYTDYDEALRELSLDISKKYQDVRTSVARLRLSEEQLELAGQNYNQSFSEYKVGKSDIVSVIQAQTALTNARQQYIQALMGLRISISGLERALGIQRLEDLR